MRQHSFKNRHIGIDSEDEQSMCEKLGLKNIEELIDQVIPQEIRLKEILNLPSPLSEVDYLKQVDKMASKNKSFKNYIGQGYYETHTPTVIQRNILENPGWYTAYTPYQAEISQGRLEALLNFQTMVVELTGMEIANSSLLDEATAAAEAMILAFNTRTKEQKQKGCKTFFIDKNSFSQTKNIIKTRAHYLNIEIEEGDFKEIKEPNKYFGIFLQYPSADGSINDFHSFFETTKQKDFKLIVAADLMALTFLKPPGEWGADVVVGTTQRFGIPLGFGGPHAAFFATKEVYKRDIPGRIIGVSIDKNGNPALRMALQTREQHIKRERATSNICTSQVLLAVMSVMYAIYHGKKGLKAIAKEINNHTRTLYELLYKKGLNIQNNTFFDTLTIFGISEEELKKVKAIAEKECYNFHYSKNCIGISCGELTGKKDIEYIYRILITGLTCRSEKTEMKLEKIGIPDNLQRQTDFFSHKLFEEYHSETSMMRYMKSLENKDLSLTHSMISLGSCTMKLNSASELIPISNPLWSQIHPFAPKNQVAGYIEMLTQLENDLSIITGFEATSLQPNSGAQGEYAGLLTIRKYQESINQGHRDIVFIPSSAHGTNPASAVMAGLKVQVIKCDNHGNIDIIDLKQKIELYKDTLCCIMITYPSTHGVYEEKILSITDMIHRSGGQVYMDGANMNAQVGLTNPKIIGADVCHLNLHKTFAIPHGGGGPGVGPICVAKHLAEFLPDKFLFDSSSDYSVSAAPYGSALICLISYGYIRMLGAEGLAKSTQIAILSANYLKYCLEKEYPILYTNYKNRVAHEMILDCRYFKADTKIDVVDIAKRLIDYGFHAPTVSFPVAGTLMIEPTESESKQELDRFIKVMKCIRKEIEEVQDNQNFENNVLKNAPHTSEVLVEENWVKPYTRVKAVFPMGISNKHQKYWPSVSRINEAHGDRNLICSCVGIEAYTD